MIIQAKQKLVATVFCLMIQPWLPNSLILLKLHRIIDQDRNYLNECFAIWNKKVHISLCKGYQTMHYDAH